MVACFADGSCSSAADTRTEAEAGLHSQRRYGQQLRQSCPHHRGRTSDSAGIELDSYSCLRTAILGHRLLLHGRVHHPLPCSSACSSYLRYPLHFLDYSTFLRNSMILLLLKCQRKEAANHLQTCSDPMAQSLPPRSLHDSS